MTKPRSSTVRGAKPIVIVAGAAGLSGAVGIAAVSLALVAELLSPAWAVVAAASAAAVLAAALLLVAMSPRIATGLVRRFQSRSIPHYTKLITDLDKSFKTQINEQSKSFRRVLDVRLAQESRGTRLAVDHLYSQLEALDALYRVLEPGRPLPPLRGWAVSPDLALHMVRLVLAGTVRTVIETGSGTSTIVLALALERAGGGRVVALEHDPAYAAATRRMLEDYDLSERATVLDAPLIDYSLDGEAFRWYDLGGVDHLDAVDLLLVDGPPEATGHHARYPAVPLLRHMMASPALVVLDDADRTGETEVAQRWAELHGVGDPITLPVERQAAQLVIEQAALDRNTTSSDPLNPEAR